MSTYESTEYAKPILANWLNEMNIKKILQHPENNVFIPLAVSK